MSERDLSSSKEKAVAAFLAEGDAHRNCAQAVMLFVVDALHEEPERIEVARYLGGGVGRSGLTCGALIGAALGLAVRDERHPEAGAARAAEACRQLQRLRRDFEARFVDTTCRELSGCDLSTEAGLQRFGAEGVRRTTCVEYVGWTCDRLSRAALAVPRKEYSRSQGVGPAICGENRCLPSRGGMGGSRGSRLSGSAESSVQGLRR